jgi:CMP-N-acetylneuraminic acid synthetase
LNGAIYISEVNYLKINNGFLGEQTKAIIMPRERSIDIDSLLDFILVKEVIKHGIDLKAYL